MKLKKYTETMLKEAVNECFSLIGVLRKLNISPAGGNYETLKKAIEHYSLNVSHFTGQGHLKGKTHQYRTRPLDQVLVESKYENTYRLKKRLIKESVKEEKCENCGITEWCSQKVPLELHHVDGNRRNNELKNLSLLCANCHALTDNYRGKNKFKNS